MKIAVTSQGTTKQDKLNLHFGRAPYFMIYDTEQKTWSSHSNTQNFEAAQGAGIQAAQNITKLGVSVLITGSVGPKAFRVLVANNIKMYTISSPTTVENALTSYENNELSELSFANGESHWV